MECHWKGKLVMAWEGSDGIGFTVIWLIKTI
jgi:hypothetical protein